MVLRYISSVNIGNLGNSEGSRVLNALEGQWTAGYRLRDELLNSHQLEENYERNSCSC